MTLRSLALILVTVPLFPQTANTDKMVPTKDPGVARAELIRKPTVGVDVLRLELQPGSARSVHQHDDVKFHLFLPLSGSIEITMGDKKMAGVIGQAYFFETGTPHGFKNTGATVASGFEVFVRDPKPAALLNGTKPDAAHQKALALAVALASAN